MKISFYFDVYPGMQPQNAIVSTSPGDKVASWKRYRVDVEIPDPNSPDVVVEGKPEEVVE